MFIKFCLLYNNAYLPVCTTKDAACADICLPVAVIIEPNAYVTIDLNIAFDIPIDWCLYLQPRSSTFTKHGLLSTTGIIDSDYHGTIHAQLFNMDNYRKRFDAGTRLVQVHALPKQRMQFEQVEYINETEHKGLGSTGL